MALDGDGEIVGAGLGKVAVPGGNEDGLDGSFDFPNVLGQDCGAGLGEGLEGIDVAVGPQEVRCGCVQVLEECVRVLVDEGDDG